MTTQIKVRKRKGDKTPAVFEYDFGADFSEAVGLFGEPMMFAATIIVAKQQLQDFIRRLLTKKKNPPTVDQIQAQINDWKPGIRRRGKSTIDKARALFDAMGPDERAAFVRGLDKLEGVE